MEGDDNKWRIPGWGAAQGQIRDAVLFLCAGKGRPEREQIAEELVGTIRAIARGEQPPLRSDPLLGREDHSREAWARRVADNLVSAVMLTCERTAAHVPDQNAVLREIAKLALWHMPNATIEARELVRTMEIEKLKQPHPGDDR
jgi:hypothetical protein